MVTAREYDREHAAGWRDAGRHPMASGGPAEVVRQRELELAYARGVLDGAAAL